MNLLKTRSGVRQKIIIISTVGTIFFVLFFNVTQAQNNPGLAFSPASVEVDLVDGQTTVVEVLASNAQNLNGFDITLTYNQNLVRFIDYQLGEMLSNLHVIFESNQPGIFRLAAIQLAQPPVSSGGVLFRLIFNGLDIGISPLTLDQAIFVDPDGIQTLPDTIPGSLEVFPPRFSLNGEIWLEGQTIRSGIPISLSQGEHQAYGPYQTISDDQTGVNFSFDKVVGDSYVIATHQPRYLNLSVELNQQLTLNKNMVLPELKLRGGNAIWTDNAIDISDVSVVSAWYGKTSADLQPGQSLDADVNFDGRVNIIDLAMVAGNFGLTSEVAYQGWLP